MKNHNREELKVLTSRAVLFIAIAAVLMAVIIIHKANQIDSARTEKTK